MVLHRTVLLFCWTLMIINNQNIPQFCTAVKNLQIISPHLRPPASCSSRSTPCFQSIFGENITIEVLIFVQGKTVHASITKEPESELTLISRYCNDAKVRPNCSCTEDRQYCTLRHTLYGTNEDTAGYYKIQVAEIGYGGAVFDPQRFYITAREMVNLTWSCTELDPCVRQVNNSIVLVPNVVGYPDADEFSVSINGSGFAMILINATNVPFEIGKDVVAGKSLLLSAANRLQSIKKHVTIPEKVHEDVASVDIGTSSLPKPLDFAAAVVPILGVVLFATTIAFNVIKRYRARLLSTDNSSRRRSVAMDHQSQGHSLQSQQNADEETCCSTRSVENDREKFANTSVDSNPPCSQVTSQPQQITEDELNCNRPLIVAVVLPLVVAELESTPDPFSSAPSTEYFIPSIPEESDSTLDYTEADGPGQPMMEELKPL